MILYKIIDDILYFDNKKKGLRLYILSIIKINFFKLAYNKIKYLDYTQTYEKFTKGLYIFNIITKSHEFIQYYSYY